LDEIEKRTTKSEATRIRDLKNDEKLSMDRKEMFIEVENASELFPN
jgi:hypothetical protein